jgi:2-methylcitrate dehydratase PrpD
VEKVDMGGNSGMMAALLHHRPTNGLQAKFSMEFCMAILLVERKGSLNEFVDAVVQRPNVQEMVRRVNFYVDPEAERAGLNKMTSLLRIHLKDGRVISGRADVAKGHPANPMSYEEAAEKFRGCAQFAKWPAAKTESAIQFVRTLDNATNVSGLTAALTA